jgi:transposase-like protein
VGRVEPTPETVGKIIEGVPVEEIEAIEERRLDCPWCDSDEVEVVSEYGPHLMVAQYICRSCHSPFEVIKR